MVVVNVAGVPGTDKLVSHLVDEANKPDRISPVVNDVSAALELLEHLGKRPQTGELLRHAKALQFVFTKKGGLGVGFSKSTGFCITKLEANADGTATWSAPSFLEGLGMAVGAIVGVHEAGVLSFMLSDAATQHMRDHGLVPSISLDANLTLARGWVTDANVNTLDLGAESKKDVVSMAWASGALVDISAGMGELQVADSKNDGVYGRDKHVRDILGFTRPAVPPPHEFESFYAKLNEISLSSK